MDGEFPVYKSVNAYEKISRIGEGTYGVVYKARNRKTGELVALKRIRMDIENDGFPLTSLRELKLFKTLHHPNIVKLKDVVTGKNFDSVFLLFEYCEHDLSKLISGCHGKQKFSIAAIKCILRQILLALSYLHKRSVLHRDLKLSNLLYTDSGYVKLCDFGLARVIPYNREPLSPTVATLWYRPPELLFGSFEYDSSLDMWGIGCIMGELLTGKPLFPGRTEIDCLKHMSKLLGTPREELWHGFFKLPFASQIKLPYYHTGVLRNEFNSTFQAYDLLSQLLQYNPENRISAEKALKHQFFNEDPLPLKPNEMPRFASSHISHTEMYNEDGVIRKFDYKF